MKEIIEWFDFPDVKPEEVGYYLVKAKNFRGTYTVRREYWRWSWKSKSVIMWAKMPLGVCVKDVDADIKLT